MQCRVPSLFVHRGLPKICSRSSCLLRVRNRINPPAATRTLTMESSQLQVCELRDAFQNGTTYPIQWRLQQLNAMLRMLQEQEAEMVNALSKDIGKPAYETYIAEISMISQACKTAVKNLKKWMAPQKVSTSIISFPSTGEIVAQPLGVALVISAWNFPLLLALDPVVGAIAAGNCVVLKPSELAPATSSLLAKLVPQYMDHKTVRVVEGGIPETTALLDQQWDKIFYTGSTRVGKIVMGAAAKNLTPVVLELGGKSPVVIDSTVNLKVAARRIAFGKWANNNAQACISPDYVIAEASVVPKLVSSLKDCLREFYGEDPSQSRDLSRIINNFHFSRLTALLNEETVKPKIVFGGDRDADKLYIAPTILVDPPMDSQIMSDEIFGPLLPIISVGNFILLTEEEALCLQVDSMDLAIRIINSRPRPLALYLFTDNKALERRVIEETCAGGMVVNDTIMHFTNEKMPFGGVGHSGMGSYHGKFTFDAFSHLKPVLHRSLWPDLLIRYPPYNSKKQKLVRGILEGDYFGVLKTFMFS